LKVESWLKVESSIFNVFQNADNWASSDIVVHATNRLRPYAMQGGVVLTPTVDAQHPAIVYEMGQVHMGASWNRYGIPGQNMGDDWPLVLAHELGHYLFFLDDTYIGRTPERLLTPVGSCQGSAMGDVYASDNSEFIFDQQLWEAGCATTLAALELGRTEWQTLQLWYPAMVIPAATLSGPGRMPYSLTRVELVAPLTPTAVLDDAHPLLGRRPLAGPADHARHRSELPLGRGTGPRALRAPRRHHAAADQRLGPAQASTATTTTLTIDGASFLAPVSVRLSGADHSYELPLLAQSASQVTAVISQGLAVGAYELRVTNGDGGSALVPGGLALAAPTSACFAEVFESGLGRWQATRAWDVVRLPGGNHVLTDSPGAPYNNALPPASTRSSAIVSPRFNLAGCERPVLSFRHDYLLARFGPSQDSGLVEVSADGGATWRALARYSGGGIYDALAAPRALLAQNDDLEWATARWRRVLFDLRAYAGAEIQLRFSLLADQTIADKGWVLDDIAVESSPPGQQHYLPLLEH
jgi:hypothetical protein